MTGVCVHSSESLGPISMKLVATGCDGQRRNLLKERIVVRCVGRQAGQAARGIGKYPWETGYAAYEGFVNVEIASDSAGSVWFSSDTFTWPRPACFAA